MNKTRLLLWISAVLCMAVSAGCATAPSVPPPTALFQDHLFKPPGQPVNAAQVFALSPAMRRYLEQDISNQLRMKGRRQGLLDALYTRGQLQLEYDSTMTRNAAEAFEARSGNCLSLVIMTAAFAKHLDLPVRFQSVFVEDSWSRSGDLFFVSGHVNMALGRGLSEMGFVRGLTELMTIDFLPPALLRGQRTQVIEEATIVAMYMNNRAAESIHEGQLDQAYWWARTALVHDPKFMAAYNTLAVVYRRHGQVDQAERALRHVLAVEPANTQALSNLVVVLRELGRGADAQQAYALLQELQPHPPYKFFDLGVAAMKNGDYRSARDLFRREIDRAAYYHEFHFWLGLANYALGDLSSARKEVELALENSTTSRDRSLYTAKLDWLKMRRASTPGS